MQNFGVRRDAKGRYTRQQDLARAEHVADPGAVYRDPQKRDGYLKMYGNICFDTRDQYLSFPWSSERR
jgi:hypothetical protein